MPEPLTVGVVPGVTPDRWVRGWRDRFPRDPLRVVPLPTGSTAAVLDDGVDLAFLRLPVGGDPETLHVIPLWEETPVVAAARDHPVKLFDTVTTADLAGEDEHDGWGDDVLDLVAAGHGIVRMPQSVLRATGRRDLVGRPISDAEPTRIGLVWRREAGSPRVDEFIGVVRGRTANTSRGSVEPEARRRRR